MVFSVLFVAVMFTPLLTLIPVLAFKTTSGVCVSYTFMVRAALVGITAGLAVECESSVVVTVYVCSCSVLVVNV